ncbi:MAG: CGNR zinc finger domain-containing protein [Mycetocola sp.]
MSDATGSEPATGQWFTSLEGIRWWFDSGSLALDFAYTGPLRDADPDSPDETLRVPADLTTWLAGRLPSAEAGDRDLADAVTLRGAIGRLALASSTGSTGEARDIDLLNLYAATPDIPPRLAGGALQAGRTEPRAAQALSTIARDAVALFSGITPGRIRGCDAEDCDMIYLDTSRAGNRRWCSMQRCGNRHKVRAHRARTAAQAATR